MSSANEISKEVIGLAINVHRRLGPGLLESTYEACLAHELKKNHYNVQRQAVLPVVYDGLELETGYRIDLIVESKLIIELKAVDEIHPIHMAQVLTYLKLSKMKLGLLINFNVTMLKLGLKRVVNGLED